MAANVESMFYTRTKPWHGLGVQVQEAPESKDALRLAGLDWKVYQREVYTDSGIRIDGYRANVRNTDNRVLGVVTERYKIVQNEEAFAFTDALLGKGVRYETAGSLQDGRKVWLLARLPKEYIISGEQISPYLVFSNSHDGSAAVRVAVTPIRVVCNNTSQGVVKDIHGKKVSMKNVILMWRFESGDMEGIFLQRATDTKKMMNVLTWEGVYTQPEISKKMIRGLLMLFSNEIFGRNIQDVFNEFPKIVEMSPKVEANSENE